MKVRLLEIENFRGVERGRIEFTDRTLLVGGNNVGKSTVCEALDLVLGPERLNRRPVVDEHDFYRGAYLDDQSVPIRIAVRAVLIELTEETRRRFVNHLRRWNVASNTFADETANAVDYADEEGIVWALPLEFRARYDREEDDFEADTFFAHPEPIAEDLSDDERESLGEGRAVFTRKYKRLCGFVFLRTLRTGSRALGLQRGSLLDTILRLGGEGAADMWLDTLTRLKDLDPAVGEVERLQDIRDKLRSKMGDFVSLAEGDGATAFFASDLTRQHLREIVRLFIATEPSNYPVPFSRQGTGSINLLVFALLTIIAELKESQSVIFAMEEPEIALPPHTQRRVTRYVLGEMGQTIVTSHSPYVIEQFEPSDIVMLSQADAGTLTGKAIDPVDVKPKAYHTERRQFAEAILARAVLVVEGATEAALMAAASTALERLRPAYTHFDLAGVTLFAAKGDMDVPRYGPIFKALGKFVFGAIDAQKTDLPEGQRVHLADFDVWQESPEAGIERLLAAQSPEAVLRAFLDDVSARDDFPSNVTYEPGAEAAAIRQVAFDALKARKGDAWGYAARVMDHCKSEADVPEFLRELLITIDDVVSPRIEVGVEDSDGAQEPSIFDAVVSPGES